MNKSFLAFKYDVETQMWFKTLTAVDCGLKFIWFQSIQTNYHLKTPFNLNQSFADMTTQPCRTSVPLWEDIGLLWYNIKTTVYRLQE